MDSFDDIQVRLIDFWSQDGDKEVAHSAWASTYDMERLDQRTPADISRVVNMIVDDAHDTPKESVWLKYFMSVPIFVERQFDKYRMTTQAQDFYIEWEERAFGGHGITQNELSGRYRTIPERPYRLPSDVAEILYAAAEVESANQERLLSALTGYDTELEIQYMWYRDTLEAFPPEWRSRSHPRNPDYRRAREVFRGILGTSFFTDMRITMNLNAFEHIISQRIEAGTQMESRYVAKLMLQEALDKGVAPQTISRMASVNNWIEQAADIPGKPLDI